MKSTSKDQLIHKLNLLQNRTDVLFAKLQSYDEVDLIRQSSRGVWSVNQVLTHLMLSERLSLQYIQKKLSFDPALRRIDLFSKIRSQLLRISLLLPVKFKAPKGVQIDDSAQPMSLQLLRDTWLADRDILKDYLLGLNEELFELQVYKHPFAGRLSILQMVDFFINHLNRHEGQINSRLP